MNSVMGKDYFNCTKKVRSQLSKLYYDGEMNYPAVSKWLLNKGYYVMPIPMPYYRWEVGIVILGKPNTQDYKLNRCSIGDHFTSLDAALRAGVESVVASLDNARRVVLKHGDDKEFLDKNLKDLREEGFDV